MVTNLLYVSNHDPSDLLGHLEESLGVRFDCANNREEAIIALDSNQYTGVVMTDLRLAPGGDGVREVGPRSFRIEIQNGLDIAREVKAKGLPLIVLTTFPEYFIGETNKPDVLLNKPIDVRKLYYSAKKLFGI